MALVRVLVTVALLAFVLQFPGGGVPRHVLVKVHAVLAVIASESRKGIKLVFILKHLVLTLCCDHTRKFRAPCRGCLSAPPSPGYT